MRRAHTAKNGQIYRDYFSDPIARTFPSHLAETNRKDGGCRTQRFATILIHPTFVAVASPRRIRTFLQNDRHSLDRCSTCFAARHRLQPAPRRG
jgi:hypothetical protein